jgi:DNA-binding transcriptional LysR family regulator
MTSGSTVVLNRLLAKVRARHLQALLKLAELGHVSRAAQVLGLSQPAVTLLLADLERLLEAPLFVRHARGVTPTALTLDLLPLVRQMLHTLTESADLVATHRARGEGTVRAVTTAAGANGLLAQVLPAFLQAHPTLQVFVTEVDIPALAPSVDTGSADIVFCRELPVAPQGWSFEPCVADHFVVVCGLKHPLARRRRVGLHDLRGASWLPNSAGSAALGRHESLMAQLGEAAPQQCHVITRISPLTWTLLDSLPLLTVVPFSVVRPWVERTQLVALPVLPAMPFLPLGMLLRHGPQSTACEKLAGFVRQWAQPTARAENATRSARLQYL